MTIEGVITRTDQASKGAYQSIRKLEGQLVSVKRVPGNPEFVDDKGIVSDQSQVDLEDVIILEMLEGEPEPELEEDKFRFYMRYAPPGRERAHQNSFYSKAFLASAEAVAKARGFEDGDLSNLINTRVTLVYNEAFPLFTRTIKETGEKEEITGKGWTFIDEATQASFSMDDHIKGLVVGKNKPLALRALMQDGRAKKDPQWREALNKGTLAEKLGLEIGDGIFREKAG